MALRFIALVCLSALLVSACGTPATSRRTLTYVALGASDAVGVGATNPTTEGWVPRLGAGLGDGTRVVNLGVSGSTLNQALQEQAAPAVDARPDVVTVWLAVNDLNSRVPLERYAADLDTLLARLATTGARVLVGNVPDLAGLATFAGRDAATLSQTVDRWNQVIADTARRHGAQVVDLHVRWREVSEHPEYLSADGFHPSSDGYARLAELFAEAYAAGA